MSVGNKRPVWEWLLLAVIFVFALTLVGSVYKYQVKLDRQRNLHSQLEILRTATLLYKSINKTNPTDLKQLADGTFRLEGDDLERRYIEHPPKTINGKILDPFGNPYLYDSRNGWIKSSTRGYEFW